MTLITKELINSLPASYQEYVMARQEPPICQIKNHNEVKRALADILSKTFFDCNYGKEMEPVPFAEMLKFQTEALFNELSGKFGTLTLSEVRNAFKNGIRGEFGQYFGMCPKTYHQFIKAYFELPERGKAQIEYLNLIDQSQKPVEISESMKKMISVNGVKERFKTYKETGDLGWMPFSAYNILVDLIGVEVNHPTKGKIKTLIDDKDVRLMLFNEAKNEHKADLEKALGKARFKKNLELADRIEFLIGDMVNQPTFEQLLKKKYLKYYFDSIDTLNL